MKDEPTQVGCDEDEMAVWDRNGERRVVKFEQGKSDILYIDLNFAKQMLIKMEAEEDLLDKNQKLLAEVEKLKGPPLPLPALPAHSSFCDPWP